MAPGIVGNSIFFTGKAQGKERLRKQKLLRFIFPFLLACLLSAAPETARCNVLSPWEMPRPSLEKETEHPYALRPFQNSQTMQKL